MTFGPIVNLMLSHARGDPLAFSRHHVPPPHLLGQTWKYVCDCGYSWKLEGADPELVRGEWLGPARECVNCRTWQHGRAI